MLSQPELTEPIIQAFYRVYNVLGHGFLEKVYKNAMIIELNKRGIKAETNARIVVYYEGHEVGEYFADLLVEHKVIIELKAAESLAKEHHAQLLNYLKASKIDIGLLLNFGPKPEFKRKIYEEAREQTANDPR